MVEGEEKVHIGMLYINYNKSNIRGNINGVKKGTMGPKLSQLHLGPTSANQDLVSHLAAVSTPLRRVTFKKSI